MTAAAPKKPGPKARAKAKREQAAAIEAAIAAKDPVAAIAAATGAPPAPPVERVKPAVEMPSAPPESLAVLGAPPSDPLEANFWAHRVTLLAMHDAAIDHELSPRERRKEIRTLAASAAKLLPHARIWEALQELRAGRAEIERKASEKRGAKLEARPPRQTGSVPGA